MDFQTSDIDKTSKPWEFARPINPTPWSLYLSARSLTIEILDNNGYKVGDVWDKANADYLVNAANTHIALCEAVQKYKAIADRYKSEFGELEDLHDGRP